MCRFIAFWPHDETRDPASWPSLIVPLCAVSHSSRGRSLSKSRGNDNGTNGSRQKQEMVQAARDIKTITKVKQRRPRERFVRGTDIFLISDNSAQNMAQFITEEGHYRTENPDSPLNCFPNVNLDLSSSPIDGVCAIFMDARLNHKARSQW